MKSLISIEWLKIRRYRTFKIIVGLFILLAILGNYVFHQVLKNEKMSIVLSGDSSFSGIWFNTSYMVSHFVIFIALLMVLITGNEFQFRTHRQNIIDGWKREDFLNAKWGIAIVLALGITVFTFLLGLVVGLVLGASFSSVTSGIVSILWIFILSLNYLGAALLVVSLIRRSGLALIILLAYYLVVDNLLHSLFKFKFNVQALDFLLPLETSDQLLPIPRVNSMVNELTTYDQLPVWTYAIGSLCWVGIYYLISRTRLSKSDW